MQSVLSVVKHKFLASVIKTQSHLAVANFPCVPWLKFGCALSGGNSTKFIVHLIKLPATSKGIQGSSTFNFKKGLK